MKDTMNALKADNFIKKTALQEIRVELKDNVGVRSISSMSEKGKKRCQ